MLRELSYKGVYKSDQDHILEDFYFPTLSVATRYDRAVGFFSASTITCAAQALSEFVTHCGQIRLILGTFAEPEDLEAVKRGYRKREIIDKIGIELISMTKNISDDLFQNRFDTLAWLVANGRLDLKIAIRERGMYHDKIGIISDDSGDKVVFAGSANESTHALLPTHNYESINVFRTWVPEHSEFCEPHIESFERLWKNESRGTAVIDIPTAVRDNLISVGQSLGYTPDPEVEAAIAARIELSTEGEMKAAHDKPSKPKTINGQPFKIRNHQINALRAWKSKGDFQGIFDLATGAGKTITAIHAVVKLSEKIDGLTCVIAVPYQSLADQWVDILSKFNIYPVKCYVSRSQWEDDLRCLIHELAMGSRNFGAIVVVNRTLKSPKFQECLAKIKGDFLMWIGDECHHHTSQAYEGFLPKHAKFRIGLSATPKHYIDETRNERLNEFYGDIVSRYTLKEAVKDKVLTPYTYYPHLIEFTSEEAGEFIDLSEQIGRIVARQKDCKYGISQQLTRLLMKRARLVGSAANKLLALQDLLTGERPTRHTLFYCGDGTIENGENTNTPEGSDVGDIRQDKAVSAMLDEMSWNVSRFTSQESRNDRIRILDNFRLGLIDAMVAIRCLDEGIDIPACSTAYILASSRDPRQFIQRRGRILRRSPGKKHALIHDFIVVLPQQFDTESEYAKRLIESELVRVAEFSSLSDNRSEAYEILRPVLQQYDLEHKV
ncbi:MAG: DEAD/DEAH box helicase family protein [Rhodobacteraceae bacterium]|nr:DEAD/DEAH box helicase family protein [Paracoccaceae bacterium]